MFSKRSLLVAVLGLVFPNEAYAFFRINCGIIQTGRIDPIVNPGGIAAHAHTIVGGSNIGVNATYASLTASQCTACEVATDKSAYWTPNLYYQHENGSFEYVPHSGSVIYYLTRGPNADNLTTFPLGFQMLSGDKSWRAPNQGGMTWGNATYPSRPISEAVNFACLSDPIIPDAYGMPADPHNCVNGLRAQVHFQSCWNGKDLYKQDNSHVAHQSQIDNGICPPGYPYQLPHVFMETNYAVTQVTNYSSAGRYVFSQGDTTGYGFHGDFINGWQEDVMQTAIDTCLINNQAPFGTIDECPILLQTDSTEAPANCPERPPQILENVKGMLDKLPGCIRVTSGPGSATAADMNCAAGIPQPSIVTTVDSVPLPTYTPAIGSSFGNQYNVHLGCGNDTYGSSLRAVNAIEITDPAMTVEFCQSYCSSRGYRISGLEYGYQCFCDLTVNPSSILTGTYNSRYRCVMTCTGNRSEFCGGPAYMNIYNNTDPNFVPTTDQSNSVIQLTIPPAPYADNYYGCVTEGLGSSRTLNGTLYIAANMTLGYCRDKCQASNYLYYGVQLGNQCWCGNGLAAGGQVVDQLPTPSTGSACDTRCPGDYAQVCGGRSVLSVYGNPLYRPVGITPSSGRYLTKGCLTEPAGGARALSGDYMTFEAMTPQKCIKFCLGNQYRYAGIEYGVQCYCGNQIESGAVQESCDTSHLFTCPGNPYTYCGAGNLLNLYYSSTL